MAAPSGRRPGSRQSDATRTRKIAKPSSLAPVNRGFYVEKTNGGVAASPISSRGGTKIAQVIVLLERPGGATLAELVAATGWLPHTTRAALTGLRKRGYAVGIDRADKARGSVYRIEPTPTGGDSAAPLVGAAPTCEAAPARPKNAASLRTRRAA